MKFFTPELLERFRSRDDDVAEQAEREWERAGVAYRTRFEAIRADLPAAARRLHRRFTLHDARVLGAAAGERPARFTLLLQLASGPTIELVYRPIVGPNGGVRRLSHPQGDDTPIDQAWVLYHEFDADEERGFLTHNLLLTGGREIEVRFRDLR